MPGIKAPYNVDLAIFLGIVSVTIISFMEISAGWGFICLLVGTAFFLAWVHLRTEIFG
jgi:hypothetical protein